MTGSAAVAGAITFVWLGMVLAISFLEAPLKFRAPGVTIPTASARILVRAARTLSISDCCRHWLAARRAAQVTQRSAKGTHCSRSGGIVEPHCTHAP